MPLRRRALRARAAHATPRSISPCRLPPDAAFIAIIFIATMSPYLIGRHYRLFTIFHDGLIRIDDDFHRHHFTITPHYHVLLLIDYHADFHAIYHFHSIFIFIFNKP